MFGAINQALNIVIESTYRGDGAKRAKKDIGELDSTTRKSNRTLGDYVKGIGAASLALGGIAASAAVAYTAIKEGAALETAANQFEILTQKVNSTADAMLGKLREATRGLVSDSELIASANEIISLGLANSEEGVVQLATVISGLGLDMQQVIMTFANNSKARLDSLGLSVEGVNNKVRELEQAGFQGDAFDEAVLQLLIERNKELSGAISDTEEATRAAEAAFKNWIDTAKREGSAFFGNIILGFRQASDEFSILQDAIDRGFDPNRYADPFERAEAAQRFIETREAVDDYIESLERLSRMGREASPMENLYNERAAAEFVSNLEELGRRGREAMQEQLAAERLQTQVEIGNINELISNIDTLKGGVQDAQGYAFGMVQEFAKTPEQIVAAGLALGQFGSEQAKLILVQQTINTLAGELAQQYIDGEISASQMNDTLVLAYDNLTGAVGEALTIEEILARIDGSTVNVDIVATGFPTGTFNEIPTAAGAAAPRAEGGPVSAQRPYIVGERGPELIVPSQSGMVVPNGAGNSYNISINVAVDSSVRQFTPAIRDGVLEALQRAGAY